MKRKYTPDIELKVGMWVNCEPSFSDSFAGKPAVIVEVKPKSVVVRPWTCRPKDGNKWVESDVYGPRLIRMHTIKFVSDTVEEAGEIFNVARAHMDEAWEARSAFNAKLKELEQAAVAKALS